jgi:hypothetical protein
VSSAIRMQLRIPICKAIKISETYVLLEIDRMIQGKAGIGKQNPLATWVVLWILILSYKEYMIFCKASCSDDHGTFGPGPLPHSS